MGWQPIETAPKDYTKIIVWYLNRNSKSRTVMARWLTDEQAAETDADGVGLEGGWYECIDNWDDYTEVAIHEGEPTHWMPLPAPPMAPADVAKAAFAEMQRKDAERIAALPPGTCEQCEGAGWLGGQFCGGSEWTCEECGGTGRTPN